MYKSIFTALAMLTLWSCGSPDESRQSQRQEAYTDPDATEQDDPYGDDYADDSWDDLASGSYEAEHGSSACTSDCSGHEAGYRWAEDHGITDPTLCGGNSNSFIEGCQAYANDNR